MFVTVFYRFVALCLVWSFVVGPLIDLACRRFPAAGTFRQALPLEPLLNLLRRIDRLALHIPLSLVVVFLVASTVGEVKAMHTVAAYLPSERAVEYHWPLSFILTDDYFAAYHVKLFSLIRIGLALVTGAQALALRALWVRLGRVALSTVDRLVIGFSIAVVYGFAILTRTMEQPDLYAYVIIAKLGFTAYQPPLLDNFGGDFSILDHVAKVAWGGQNYPYGPLWIAVTHALFGRLPHLYGALVGMRVFETAAVVALAYAVHQLGYGMRGTLLVGLNPVIIHEYVVEAHNDIWPMALVALAFLAVRRSPVLAAVAVAAAGLMKIPYLLVGTLAFGAIVNPWRRFTAAGVTVLGALALSIGWGGRAYLLSMNYHANFNTVHQPQSIVLARTAMICIALAAIAAVVLWRRWRGVAAFSMPALAVTSYPWYLGLGLPFALLDGRILPVFLISWPVLDLCADFWFDGPLSLVFALVGAAIVAFVSFAERRSDDANGESLPRSGYGGTIRGETVAPGVVV